jgi:CheY-like chemotaxis protein
MNTRTAILIVDDVEANRQTLVELLAAEDYLLVEAGDGSEALALAIESSPDLVLLDVMMPGMDGFEVCRRLRADARLAEVPVIMVTALDDQASRLAGIEAGADDFVTKPFNRLELRARVRSITRLNRYRRLHEQRAQFQWVVDHARDGYVCVNAADEIVYSNACARLWLAPSGEGPDTFLDAARRTFALQPAEHWRGWPVIPPETVSDVRLLVRAETPQARAFFLDVSVYDNPGGRLLRLRDVTEHMATHRDQRSFQKMVSHKLRTPLNALHGSLAVLGKPVTDLPPKLAAFVAMALGGAKRLTGAVDDVLRFAEVSKLHGGTGFALGGLDEAVQVAASSVGIESCRVNVAPEAARLALTWPSAAVEWVLVELLENAKKFHPRHAPAVEVSARSDGSDHVILTVSDDGMALSSEQRAMAVQPYFQGEKTFTGEAPGMGLGLASVASLAWQAGGSCHLRNRADGPGVAVEIRLPVQHVALQPRPSASRGLE